MIGVASQPTSPTTIAEVMGRALNASSTSFAALIGGPVLVGPPPVADAQWRFRTLSGRILTVEGLAEPVMIDLNFHVFVLAKRRAGPFADRIFLGRADSNDVVLPYGSVSKLHAAVQRGPDGRMMLSDAGSSNGTSVGGRKLAAGEAVALAPGAVVSFGPSAFRYYSEDRLWSILVHLRRDVA